MNKFSSQNDIVNAIVKGVNCSVDNYAFWTSKKLYLSDATDNFLTIHIAQEIAKLQNPPEIFLDAKITDILKCSLSRKEQYKFFMEKHMLSQDTISITLDERFENNSDTDLVSRVVIDVKNNVVNNKKEYSQRIEQFCKLLQRDKKEDSTLDFAVFAFFLQISCEARIDVKKRIENIISSFDTVVNNYKNLKSNFKGGEINTIENIGEWSVGCYIIEPNISK